jgi:hypothetical protein
VAGGTLVESQERAVQQIARVKGSIHARAAAHARRQAALVGPHALDDAVANLAQITLDIVRRLDERRRRVDA